MVYRTRFSSKSNDHGSDRSEVGSLEKRESSLRSAVSHPVSVRKLSIHSGGGRDELAAKYPEKPESTNSLAATPRRAIAKKYSNENEACNVYLSTGHNQAKASGERKVFGKDDISESGSITDGSMPSCTKKTRTPSRKRQCSALSQNSPARITRSMRRAGIVTPKDIVELEIVPECSSEDVGTKESEDREVTADDLSSLVRSDIETKSSTLKYSTSSKVDEGAGKLDSSRKKSTNAKSTSSPGKGGNSFKDTDLLVSSNLPMDFAAEGRSNGEDKQLIVKNAVSSSRENIDNSSDVLSAPVGDIGREWDSISCHAEKHPAPSKHGFFEAAGDVTVPTPNLPLECECVEAASSKIFVDGSSNTFYMEKSVKVLAEKLEKRGDVQIFTSPSKKGGAPESSESLILPAAESSSNSSHVPNNICNMSEADSVQENTHLPDASDVIEASSQSGQLYSRLESFKQLFKRPKFFRRDCDSALTALYNFAFGLETRKQDLPSKFISNDVETIWQFISYRGKQIFKEFRKIVPLLENDLVLQTGAVFSSEDDSDEDTRNYVRNKCEDRGNLGENDKDLLHLEDENLNALQHEMEELHDEEDESDQNVKPSKKYPKSAVDDKFFSLAEMNAFLDEQDRVDQDSAIFLDTVDDSCMDPVNYYYEDFFGEKGDAVDDQHVEYKKRKKKGQEIGVDEEQSKKVKSVRFAMDIRQPEQIIVGEADTYEDKALGNDPVLLRNKNLSEQPESNLKRSLKRLKETIAKLEEENLATRSWQLSGEVTAQQRAENELLEKDFQFDHGTKKAPEITELFTEKLESLIRQRIKDKAFDDVIRKKRVEERTELYRSQAIEDQEMVKISLAEVYEKEYQKAVGETKNPNAVNEQHTAIEKQMRELFRLIDALSNFDYTPPEVQPEIRVVTNMPALRVEEVGMTASTDEQLLAPEELKKPHKGDLKSTDEYDRTDKLRQRRKKKNRQRAMMEVFGEKVLENQRKIKRKRASSDDIVSGTEKLKSSTFFTKLQETVRSEISEKAVKKKRVKSEQVSQSGSKYIL